MFYNHTLYGLPKEIPKKKICTIHYMLYINNENFPEGANVDTTNLHPGEKLLQTFHFTM